MYEEVEKLVQKYNEIIYENYILTNTENDFIKVYIVFSILLFIIILLGYCNLGYTYKNEEVQTLL